jgi:hypothetical protein
MSRSIGRPAEALTRVTRSPKVATGSPPTRTMLSPIWSPAFTAGSPGVSKPMTGGVYGSSATTYAWRVGPDAVPAGITTTPRFVVIRSESPLLLISAREIWFQFSTG